LTLERAAFFRLVRHEFKIFKIDTILPVVAFGPETGQNNFASLILPRLVSVIQARGKNNE